MQSTNEKLIREKFNAINTHLKNLSSDDEVSYIIEDYDDIECALFYGDLDINCDSFRKIFENYFDFFSHIDSFGGAGRGDEYWKVYKFDNDYVKFYGSYASYNGADYHDLEVVYPREKTITVWSAESDP